MPKKKPTFWNRAAGVIASPFVGLGAGVNECRRLGWKTSAAGALGIIPFASGFFRGMGHSITGGWSGIDECLREQGQLPGTSVGQMYKNFGSRLGGATAGAFSGLAGATTHYCRHLWKTLVGDNEDPRNPASLWARLATVPLLLAGLPGLPFAMAQGAIQGAWRGASKGWDAGVDSYEYFDQNGVKGLARVGSAVTGVARGAILGVYAWWSTMVHDFQEMHNIAGPFTFLWNLVSIAWKVPLAAAKGGYQGATRGIENPGVFTHDTEDMYSEPSEAEEITKYKQEKRTRLDTDRGHYDPAAPPVRPMVRPAVTSLQAYQQSIVAAGGAAGPAKTQTDRVRAVKQNKNRILINTP